MRWQDMKTNRQSKIIEIIQKNEVETQDELSAAS